MSEHIQPEAYTSDCHPMPFGEQIIAECNVPELVSFYKKFPDYETLLSYELWRTGRNEDLYTLASEGIFSQEEDVDRFSSLGIIMEEDELLYYKLEWTGANMIYEFGISKKEYRAFICDFLSIVLKAYAKKSLDKNTLGPDCTTVQHRADKVMFRVHSRLKEAYSKFN